jgi:hypothetical protein
LDYPYKIYSFIKLQIIMKRLVIGILALFIVTTALESCSSKLCPAYGSYPSNRKS